MKLCMYVGYHTANKVLHFGGDPVTQLNLKNVYKFNLSFCIPKYAQCWCNLHMRDEAIHYKLYLLKLTMAVDILCSVSLKEHFNVRINLLCMCFCTIPSIDHTRLNTALVNRSVIY